MSGAGHLEDLGRNRAGEPNMDKKRNEKKKRRVELRPEYDLSELKGRVRGKYTSRYNLGSNLVLLSPDVAEHFPDD